MELAFLVWVISILGSIEVFVGLIGGVFVIAVFAYLLMKTDYNATPFLYRWPLLYAGLASLCFLVVTAIPSEKTAYTMVAAYATQKVVEDPKVQQLGAKTLKVIENKLDEYIEEADKSTSAPTKQ